MHNDDLWVLISRSEADADMWIAHCLDLDIVAWGETPLAARKSVQAGVEMAILDDLNEGFDPLGRTKAPGESYETLRHLQQVGRPVSLPADASERENVTQFAVIIQLSFVPATEANAGIASPTKPWPGPGFANCA